MDTRTIWQKIRADKPIKLRVYRQVRVNGVTRLKRVRDVVPDEVALGNEPVMSERRER